MVVCGAFLFFLLVTGCILKIGRDSLCNSLIQNVPNVTRLDTHSHVCLTPPPECKTTPENDSEIKWLLTSSVFVSPSVAIKPRTNNGLLLSREESSTTACTKLRSVGLFRNLCKSQPCSTSPSVKAQTVHVFLTSPLCLRPIRRQRGSTSSSGSSSERCSSSRGIRAPGQRWWLEVWAGRSEAFSVTPGWQRRRRNPFSIVPRGHSEDEPKVAESSIYFAGNCGVSVFAVKRKVILLLSISGVPS